MGFDCTKFMFWLYYFGWIVVVGFVLVCNHGGLEYLLYVSGGMFSLLVLLQYFDGDFFNDV